jgi:hypothetical protein
MTGKVKKPSNSVGGYTVFYASEIAEKIFFVLKPHTFGNIFK